MTTLILALLLAQLPPNDGGQMSPAEKAARAEQAEFMRQCVEQKPQLDCLRDALIRFGKYEAVEPGALVTGQSNRLQIRVSGDRWLRKRWEGEEEKVSKDLGLFTESISFLDFEIQDPTAPSPTESILVAELGVMLDEFFAKLAAYRVTPQYLGEPTFVEKVLPSGNLLKLASRCYTFAATTNCGFIGVAEGKDIVRGVTAHSTGALHPDIGKMIDSIQLR